MRRILFRWRGLVISSYPAMLYLGLVAGIAAGNLAAHAARVNAWRVCVATLVLIGPSLAGARALYVAARWKHYRTRLRRIWNRQEGGLEMYGGMPVMLMLSVPVLRLIGLGLGAFWDTAIFTILTGMIFTKIGCLLNGCCGGRISDGPIAISLPDYRGVWEKRIPIQCLEAGWAAMLLIFASALIGRLPFQGALFLCVGATYAAGRLALESMREPEPGAVTIVPGYAFSIATIVLAIGVLAARWLS